MAKGREQETAVATSGAKSVTKPTPVSVGQLADDAESYGMSFDRQDLAIPFFRIVQSNSPQVLQGRPEFMEDARPGMFINTATGQLWSGQDGVLFLPVTYQRSFIEWKPRERGGGFVKDWGTDDSPLKTTQRNDKNKDIMPNGNEFTTNALYFGYIVNPHSGAAQQVALNLTGTQMKKSRKFNTALETATRRDDESGRDVKVAPFYRLWQLTTVPEQNDKGNWYGIKLEPAMVVFEVAKGEELYEAAKRLHQQVSRGEVKTQEPTMDLQDDPGAEGVSPF
jgi:hypothetical protein